MRTPHQQRLGADDHARERAPVHVDGGKIDGERAACAFGVGQGGRRLGQLFYEGHAAL